MTALMTNLILDHGISDVLNHASKLIHVFGIFQEPGHRASLCQCGEVFQDNIQLAIMVLELGGRGPTAAGYSSSLPLYPRPLERALLATIRGRGPAVSTIQSFRDTPLRSETKVSLSNRRVYQNWPKPRNCQG